MNHLLKDQRQNTMHIAFGVDDNYAKFMGITINSIIFHHIGQPLCFHIFSDKINQSDLFKLELFPKMYRNVKIKFYDLSDCTLFDHCHTYGHLTKAMFYRLVIPKLLPREVSKVLYLDSDIICSGNLHDLWKIDLSDKLLAATKDYTSGDAWMNLPLKTDAYFNSGVLLMNIKKWLAENFTEQILECLRSHPKFPDQDALNLIVNCNYIHLPRKFNHMLFDDTMLQKLISANCLSEDFSNSPSPDTVLIHYATSIKPWQKYYADTPHKKIFWQYTRRSLWFDLTEEEPYNITTVLLMIEQLKKKQNYKEALHYAEILIEHFHKK